MTEATDPSRLRELAGELGVTIPPDGADRLLAYLDAMLTLNERINLTAVRDRESAVVFHALDSLAFGLTDLRPHHALDLGTGNGFPGVAVAALHPSSAVVLMDRTGKKVRAIGSALLQAGLEAVETMQLDAAQAPSRHRELRHAFDVVTARAVGRPDKVGPLAEPLCRPGGHLVLWLEENAELPTKTGRFRLEQRIPYELPEPGARRRVLGVWRR